MKTITLPDGGTITTDDAKAARLEREVPALSLVPNSETQYSYEFVDGSSAICTFVGWESLNLIFRRVDEERISEFPRLT